MMILDERIDVTETILLGLPAFLGAAKILREQEAQFLQRAEVIGQKIFQTASTSIPRNICLLSSPVNEAFSGRYQMWPMEIKRKVDILSSLS